MSSGYIHSLLLSSFIAIVSSYSTIIKDVYVVVEDTLTLECEMIPVPERFRGNTTIEMFVDGVSIGSMSSSSKLSHSLTKTRDSSSVKNGKFTCHFSDDFLQIFREARYGVREIPDAPHGVFVNCQADQFMATVGWIPGYNLAQVTNFRVEMKTQFSLDEWFLANSTDVSKTSIDLSLNGWVSYTFRVLAQNEATISAPGESTAAPCVTPRKAPDSNPQDVASIGNQTDYLVVQWQAMPRLLHNGEGFMYRLTYKKLGSINPGKPVLIRDWHTTEKKIETGDVFTRYEVTVTAVNDLGDSTEAAAKHTLYSSETAPNISVPLIEIGRVPMGTDEVEVEYILKWTKELERSVQMNGVFGGFRIKNWAPSDPEKSRRDRLISKENLQPVTECDRPADFYIFKVDGLRANLLYQSNFTVRNTYFDGPTTKLNFLTQSQEVENLRADCCKRYQKKTTLLWEMHEDRINPDGIQGKLHGFKLRLSYYYSNEDIVQVNKTVPIAILTREDTTHGLVKFSTVLDELKLDRPYTIEVTPLRERCDWSITETAKFTTVQETPTLLQSRKLPLSYSPENPHPLTVQETLTLLQSRKPPHSYSPGNSHPLTVQETLTPLQSRKLSPSYSPEKPHPLTVQKTTTLLQSRKLLPSYSPGNSHPLTDQETPTLLQSRKLPPNYSLGNFHSLTVQETLTQLQSRKPPSSYSPGNPPPS
ncbi:hypothetical protein ScPMuIL_016776 [Solemya velum]